MSMHINDNKYLFAPKHLDARYGPYQSIGEALEHLEDLYRVKGLVVGIITEDGIQEYWFKEGVADEDLVKKLGEQHPRLHDMDSADDHAPATGDDKGKWVRSNPDTGAVEYVTAPINDKAYNVPIENVEQEIIQHNLGKYPSVHVKNSEGKKVIVNVRHIDENNTEITWDTGYLSGVAIFN